MKITIVGSGIMPIPPKGWGAIEILTWDYKCELEKLGHKVEIVNTTNRSSFLDTQEAFENVSDYKDLETNKTYNSQYYLDNQFIQKNTFLDKLKERIIQ
jgi:hypothetical protein